jgi:hypothetical protein
VSLPRVLAEMQDLLLCWAGYCPVCDRSLEAEPPTTDTG